MEYEESFDFKLKKEYYSGFEVFEVAKQILGEPGSINYSGSAGYAFDFYEGSWRFNESKGQTELILKKPYDGEIELSVRTDTYYDWDINYFAGLESNYSEWKDSKFSSHNSDWKVLFFKFKEAVHKPWEDWTEEEIISDPKWVFLFYQWNGMVSDAMHNSMVLSESSNPYIKKYILLWQKLNQSQSQNQSQSVLP